MTTLSAFYLGVIVGILVIILASIGILAVIFSAISEAAGYESSDDPAAH